MQVNWESILGSRYGAHPMSAALSDPSTGIEKEGFFPPLMIQFASVPPCTLRGGRGNACEPLFTAVVKMLNLNPTETNTCRRCQTDSGTCSLRVRVLQSTSHTHTHTRRAGFHHPHHHRILILFVFVCAFLSMSEVVVVQTYRV